MTPKERLKTLLLEYLPTETDWLCRLLIAYNFGEVCHGGQRKEQGKRYGSEKVTGMIISGTGFIRAGSYPRKKFSEKKYADMLSDSQGI